MFTPSETKLFVAFFTAQVMMCLPVEHIRHTDMLIFSDLQTLTSYIKPFISVILSISPRMEKK